MQVHKNTNSKSKFFYKCCLLNRCTRDHNRKYSTVLLLMPKQNVELGYRETRLHIDIHIYLMIGLLKGLNMMMSRDKYGWSIHVSKVRSTRTCKYISYVVGCRARTPKSGQSIVQQLLPLFIAKRRHILFYQFGMAFEEVFLIFLIICLFTLAKVG